MLTTIESAVDQLLKTWSPEDLLYVHNMEYDFMWMVGQRIRNELKLWEDSPLTKSWADSIISTNSSAEAVDHPYLVSAKILQVLKQKIDPDKMKMRIELRKKVDELLQAGSVL